MTRHVSIAFTQLVLWYDSTRIQTWPVMLSRASASTVYPSTRSFGQQLFTDRKTNSGHSAADNVTKNLPGLEAKSGYFLLRGVGFLERVSGGYQLSPLGCELATLYQDAPKCDDWVCLLGKSLLTREPRTRAFIRLMSEPDSALYFAADEWWGGAIGRATISLADGSQVRPFVDNDVTSDLRSAIDSDPLWALGSWAEDLCQVVGDAGRGNSKESDITRSDECDSQTKNSVENKAICNRTISFIGQKGKPYSLHAISTAIRASCEVFLHLGVIRCHNDRAELNHRRAVECFGTSIAKDFGWSVQPEETVELTEVLSNALSRLATESGFVVASELRMNLLENGFENPDREIAKLEAAGKLVISETGYGHSRHGVGLYEDQSKQLVKIRLN